MNLDNEALRIVVAKAIFENIPQQERDKLLSDAIGKMMVPEKQPYNYNDKETPLERLFKREIMEVAQGEVRKAVAENAELRSKIQEMINRSVTKALESKDEILTTNLAHTIAQALCR